MLDSVDYAANAGVVPAVACMGEKDVFFQAHVLMGEAMEKEGLKMVNLISPGTGHVIDPATHAEQMRRIGEYAAKGLDHAPQHTPVRHLDAEVQPLPLARGARRWRSTTRGPSWRRRSPTTARSRSRSRRTSRVRHPPAGAADAVRRSCASAARKSPLPTREPGRRALWSFVLGSDGKWSLPRRARRGRARRQAARACRGRSTTPSPTPFLCVRGTGKAWNPAVQAWADASLKRFAYEWHRYFRGELPVKDDTDVTEDDVRALQPDPLRRPRQQPAGSPRCCRKLPVTLDPRRTARSATERYSAADHAPVLIQPNPLAARGPLRRPQQRPHVPREGTRVAQLPALPAAGRLGRAAHHARCRDVEAFFGRVPGGSPSRRILRRTVEEASVQFSRMS